MKPTFNDLSTNECRALLTRNAFGRLAFTFHDRVDIEPIGYAFAHEWIIGRTSAGTKLTTLLHHPWVAFEVDEVRGPYDWRSVIVHGAVELLSADHSPKERRVYDEALAVLRDADPRVAGPDDPVPHRTVVFRIHAEDLTGRRAVMGQEISDKTSAAR